MPIIMHNIQKVLQLHIYTHSSWHIGPRLVDYVVNVAPRQTPSVAARVVEVMSLALHMLGGNSGWLLHMKS